MSFLSFLQKKEKPQYFLALLLRDEKVSAVIFEEFQGKAQIKGLHEEHFEGSIEETPVDKFLEVLDKAISTAESSLPQNIETQKTVFGVKENWIDDSKSQDGTKIKKEYLLKLKKACDALGLSPIGFLVIHEAIAHLMKLEEGAPVSAILVEVNKANIAISIFRAGRILETKRVEIEESIPKTCDKTLHSFTSCEILPSRVILFDGDETEDLQQKFIGHTWSKNLSFLHVPQITVLPKNFDARAILFGAASQMGFEFLDEGGEEIKTSTVPGKNGASTLKDEDLKENEQEEKIENKEEPVIHESKVEKPQQEEDFGFMKEEDVLKDTEEPQADEEEKLEKEPKILAKQPLTASYTEEDSNKNSPEENKNSVGLTKNLSAILSTITGAAGVLIGLLNIVKIPKFPNFANKSILLFPLLFVFSLVAIAGFYVFNQKATVNINLTPKVVEQNKDIIFSSKASSDLSKNIINGETLSISEDGESSINVEGKKEVGTEAKGTVTIYSRLPQNKTFTQGTVIKSSNNLTFTLDKAVTVASSSGDASSAPTTATVSVKAEKIGKESNLPSGTKFTIGSFDQTDVVGKNDSAFSGGTKKEITAVSKSDMDKLLTKLPKELEENAKNSLTKKVSSEKSILPVFIDATFTKKEFNQKIGDEVTKLTLKGTVAYEAISYNKNELDEFFKNVFANDIKDMDLPKNGIKYDLKNIKVKNKEVSANIVIKAYLFPKIDKEKLAKEISGKTFDEAQDIILEYPQTSSSDISLSPKLPLIPKILPRFSNNIKISIEFHN